MPKVIPLGDRILVKRRKIATTLKDGKTEGGIVLPETTQDRPTDLADVVYVPDLTFSDEYILDHSEKIVKALTKKAEEGNVGALKALLDINAFVKLKAIKVGDAVFISKYVGTDFHQTGSKEILTLVNTSDLIGLVVDDV